MKEIYHIKDSEISIIPWYNPIFFAPKEEDIPVLKNKLLQYAGMNFKGMYKNQTIGLMSVDKEDIQINIERKITSKKVGGFVFLFQTETKYLNDIVIEINHNNLSNSILKKIKKAVFGVYDLKESLVQSLESDPDFKKRMDECNKHSFYG